MTHSPLFGRRVHISGSIAKELAVASTEDVNAARNFVSQLVAELVRLGANFVIPVDAENVRDVDGVPVCFDWLVWKALKANLARRPAGVSGPFAVAVQHHKSEDQIPDSMATLWDDLRGSDLVSIENAAQWNMNSKRMEAQARYGEILIALGGGEGVLYLANLYHDAGKPVVPLNLPLCAENTGARKLYQFGLVSAQTARLFQVVESTPHTWLNRIRFPERELVADRVRNLVSLLEALDKPRAFAVRLLNPMLEANKDVQDFFDIVARPVLEDELGYRLVVIDGKQGYDHARIDQEIFAKLHRSSVVIADLTGERPNCFLELGYALGRGLPTMVTVREGTNLPFDVTTFSGLYWTPNGSVDERREAFRVHWKAIRNRPSLVPSEPLIS